MNYRITLAVVVLVAACDGSVAAAGDAAAGKTRAAACIGCHQPGSFAGKPEAALATRIEAVAAGKTAHPPVGKLSAEDVANIAAFYATAPRD